VDEPPEALDVAPPPLSLAEAERIVARLVMGLRSMVRSECPELKEPGARLPVAQRLKREGQIINKLARLDSM